MSNCKVIALTNQKGGVGKTTTAVNLGVSLVQQGKKVLLIDADAQANLTMALGYNRPDDIPITLSTVMQNIIDDKTLDASQGIIHHREGVDLLPSNIELSGFEVRLINAMSRERVLKTYVNEVKKNYDYVLIDCMPSLGMLTINALAAADSVVIPTQPHYLSAKGLELLLRSVSKVRRQINPHLRIDGILMTIPLWAVTLIGGLFITVLSFIMIMSVYGRFFKLYLYTAIAPVPLSAFAGEPSQSVGKSFIKSYSAVCLEGAIIVLACIIFSLFAAAPPVVNPDAAAVTMVWSYVGELIFNMLILVGAVKMADRVVREMMGL